jgi:chromosome segregation protein
MITHNKKTMEAAGSLYGVTMQEPGVSKLVSVRFDTPETRQAALENVAVEGGTVASAELVTAGGDST